MIDVFYYDGKVNRTDLKSLEKLRDKQVWLDINNITKEEAEQLRIMFDLHPLTEEDILMSNVRVKIEEFNSYLFFVFYGIQKNAEIELVELDFLLGKNFLITNHIPKLATFEELKSNSERLESLFKKGNDFIMHFLIDREIDNYFPILENIDDEIETIEENATTQPHPKTLTRILQIKRNLVKIKKVSLPQREKLGQLTREHYPEISRKAIPYFRDVYDHAVKASDAIDNYREAVSNTFDAYMSTVSNRMSEVMKVLSVIATMAMPLTVISGIYGTNFEILPGAHSAWGFWIMIGVMFLFSGGMLVYFRKHGWF
jgi:magnesium transporter